MHWIYLSTHFDDVIFSCGGLVSEQTARGDTVEIWTVCAGPANQPFSPLAQQIHASWSTGVDTVTRRKYEDARACRLVGAGYRRFSIPDCIYRWTADGQARIQTNEQLFSPLTEVDESLVRRLSRRLQKLAPPNARLVGPMALGGHIDHRLTRRALEVSGLPHWYYADYPYILKDPVRPEAWEGVYHQPVGAARMDAWVAAAAAYRSQFSTYWKDMDDLWAHLEGNREVGGTLWQLVGLRVS
jgi:LmbE family N-acetylglucosaminyl deacetylase